MAPYPPFTSALMAPVSRNPDPAGVRRNGPIAAYRNICPVPYLPLLIDPYMAGAGRNRPDDRMPHGAYRHINLRGSGVGERPCAKHQDGKKSKLYKFLLHTLVFKFMDWTAFLLKS